MGRSLRILAAGAVIPWLAAAALAGGPTKKTPQGPVSEITQKMTGVAGDLGKTQTGEPVQTKEKVIVGDLDDADRRAGEAMRRPAAAASRRTTPIAAWPTR